MLALRRSSQLLARQPLARASFHASALRYVKVGDAVPGLFELVDQLLDQNTDMKVRCRAHGE